MLLVNDRNVIDSILKQAKDSRLADYRYDMLRFRLNLSQKANGVFTSYVDNQDDVSVSVMIRKPNAKEKLDLGMAHFIIVKRRDDIYYIIAEMVRQIWEILLHPFVMSDWTEEDIKPMQALLSRQGFRVNQNEEVAFATFVLDKDHLESPPLLEGLTLKELDHTAPYVENFNADQGVFSGSDMKYLLCDFIRFLPSIGAFTPDGDLVGYLLTNDYGSIGKLYVKPEYRRRQIASCLIANLSNRMVQEGYFRKCLINAMTTNEKSYACFLKLGYRYIEKSERYYFVVEGLDESSGTSDGL